MRLWLRRLVQSHRPPAHAKPTGYEECEELKAAKLRLAFLEARAAVLGIRREHPHHA